MAVGGFGLDTGGTAVAGAEAGAAGALALGPPVAVAADAAFLSERIAVGGSPLALFALAVEAPPRIRSRMRTASSSLMELLWLRAAMASFSAASSTSLLSRPRSRDSS
jgi:hypothetical protein